MKYKVLKDGIGKDGRAYDEGRVVELDEGYAEHLIGRRIVEPLKSPKVKQRAVTKPDDLEQATGE